ncbi:transposase [Rhodobacteraceae bacterium 2CG4]|uniref:Transposase n=1 Tax=Halovulum marinum TaxID=2662447 RepID=A0A6L5YUU5_9RHOB|nr:transposase [Halovulum marinum]MSU88051.1 transposase [Halovulum marinum]
MTHPRPPRPGESARFFTVSLTEPGASTLVDRIDQLRAAFASLLRAHPVRVDAMVILPDHLHAVWVLPPADTDFAARWRILKGRFTRLLSEDDSVTGSPWQPRFGEQRIRTAAEHAAQVAYCWQDPVRHGQCRRAADWPYSSFRRDMRRGLVTADWRPPTAGVKGMTDFGAGPARGPVVPRIAAAPERAARPR